VNKTDLLDDAGREDAAEFLSGLDWASATVPVSAQTGDGLKDLVRELAAVMDHARAVQEQAEANAEAEREATVLRPADGRLDAFTIEAVDDYFVVHGVQMEKLFAKADLENPDAVAYLQQVIERAGLNDALRHAGAVPGDTVVVGEHEFEFA
jgi:GTP-binding protein